MYKEEGNKVEKANRKQTKVNLKRVGDFPMPIDLVVTYKNGKKDYYTIPLAIMRGEKKSDKMSDEFKTLPDWRWTHRDYEVLLDVRHKNIEKVEIDPSKRMADIKRNNNSWIKEKG